MRKIYFIAFFFPLLTSVYAQPISRKIQQAYQQFDTDAQLKYATSSLYVIDAITGQVVFDKNSSVGLAPASTQKVVTAATAFELLGKDFRYKTTFVLGKGLNPSSPYLYIHGSGDPTFGSWRYAATKDTLIMRKIFESLRKAVPRLITVMDTQFETAAIPDGYIWQDIGNYYGAGHYQLNWKENQYTLTLRSDKPGLLTEVTGVEMDTTGLVFYNEVTKGAAGSGDNAYIYCPPHSKQVLIRGTISPDRKSFPISGAAPDPPAWFAANLKQYLERKWKNTGSSYTDIVVRRTFGSSELTGITAPEQTDTIYTHWSPSLDSIVYWFLQKSINLYGEALLRTLAVQQQNRGATDAGTELIKDFWKKRGIDENELNISDGSGLSPQNRVTTHAQVEILKYAKKQTWFPSFYKALPEYNNMKMKSGTIRDVKGFCGYHEAADGRQYIFSFLVNNYNGSSSALVNKMYKVLDVLK